jgi:integrase
LPLTDTAIKGSKAGVKAYKLYDRDGLFLLVKPNGAKLFRLKYRYNGKEKLMALGEYPYLSLATVRERTLDARKKLANNIDPMAEKQAQAKAKKAQEEAAKNQEQAKQRASEKTFKVVTLQWHKWWAPGVDAETSAYIMRRLEADVLPAFGDLQTDDIKASHIRNLILGIERERGASDVAKRQHGTISQIFRYAITHELAERNPAADFKPSDVLQPRKTQNRAHIEPDELPKLLVAMDEYDGQPIVRNALKLMAITFVRTQELLKAPWAEFDVDNGVWKISAERMKKDRPHIVPLPRQAVEILRDLKRLAGDKLFVFPGLNKTTAHGTINCNSILNALAEIGYKSVMTGHGYRGLARTILAENGFDKEHVELQLSHSSDDKTDAAYNHARYLSQRKAILTWWADYLDEQLEKGRNNS